ncbi:MAG: TetR/AcrR family transcriptional regulator [Actinomycetota bacterium]
MATPDPSASRPLDARAVRSRAAILAAGVELLSTEGWSAITHQRVAEVAGVGRATVYRHWSEPGELVHDVLEHALALEAYEVTHNGSTRDDLIAELAALAAAVNEGLTHDVIATLVQRSTTDDRLRAFNARMSRLARRGVWQVVQAATERGELDPGLDETTASAMLIGPLVYVRMLVPQRIEARHIESVVDGFLLANRRRQSRPPPTE